MAAELSHSRPPCRKPSGASSQAFSSVRGGRVVSSLSLRRAPFALALVSVERSGSRFKEDMVNVVVLVASACLQASAVVAHDRSDDVAELLPEGHKRG